jgi:hypothetical protein
MSNRFTRIFPIILILLALLIHGYVAIAPANNLVNWFTIDDAYYYFKVAQNVTEGHGFTFDGINTASGFHPLWMLVCIPVFALARYDLILPLRILAIIAGLLNAASAVLLFTTFRKVLSQPVAALISFFWAFSPLVQPVISHNGMEAGINAFSTILFMALLVNYQLSPREKETGKHAWFRLFWLGAAAVLVMLSRLDNIFLVGVAGLWLVYQKNEQRYPVILMLLLAFASVPISFFLRVGFRESYIQYMTSIYFLLVLSVILKMTMGAIFGQFTLPRKKPVWKDLITTALVFSIACGISGLLMLVLYRLGTFDRFPRTVILIDWVITFIGAVLLSLIYHVIPSAQQTETQTRSIFQQVQQQIHIWWQHGSAYFLPVGTVLLLYTGWNKLTFGTFTPVSGQIKHWWGTIYTVYGKPINTLVEFFGYDSKLKRGPWALGISGWNELAEQFRRWHWIGKDSIPQTVGGFLLVFIILFVLLAIVNRKTFSNSLHKLVWLPLVAGSLQQLFYYHGTGYVNTRDWYWVSQMLVILWLAAIFTELFYQQLLKWKIPAAVPVMIMAAFAIVWLFQYGKMVIKLVPPTVLPENEAAYLGPIQLLEQATEPGAVIGSTGGGNIAYFIHDRTIVNLDGLMNSVTYFKSMKNGTASFFLDQMGLDYVFGNAYMITESDPYNTIFANHLEKMDYFANATLYRYSCPVCE